MTDIFGPTVGSLAAALAKAQSEMSNPTFDRTNPHFRNKFASLAAVRNAVIPSLAKNGIACIQDLHTDNGGVRCVTVLIHTSGERFSTQPLAIPSTKPDAQGLGSAATYARRYQLMAIAGVVGDDDDDANAASSSRHDPRDGLEPADQKEVDEYVSRIADIVNADKDEGWQADQIFQIHLEIRAKHELYVAVGEALKNRKILSAAQFKAIVTVGSKRYQEGHGR